MPVMKHLWILLLVICCSSCQFFETEKISAETFYEEEMAALDWREVDQYPAFQNCNSITEKSGQKSCFETSLSQQLQEAIALHKQKVVYDLLDTLHLKFTISKEGRIISDTIVLDSLVRLALPELESRLNQGISNLPTVSPAQKRGVPVTTQFTLPIILTTKSL